MLCARYGLVAKISCSSMSRPALVNESAKTIPPSSVEDANGNHQHCVLPIVVRLTSLWVRSDSHRRSCPAVRSREDEGLAFFPFRAFFA